MWEATTLRLLMSFTVLVTFKPPGTVNRANFILPRSPHIPQEMKCGLHGSENWPLFLLLQSQLRYVYIRMPADARVSIIAGTNGMRLDSLCTQWQDTVLPSSSGRLRYPSAGTYSSNECRRWTVAHDARFQSHVRPLPFLAISQNEIVNRFSPNG